ncbi:MAG: hypothetical protein CMJ58_14740 [Planctomycetaceae bacterium]|nr:hypothetical protein [Planctomycetaceae bacterium]
MSMSTANARPPLFRISLREFLLLAAVVVVALASLKFANRWWLWSVSTLAILLTLAMLVVAMVDRGRRQSVAIGFVACVLGYGGVLQFAQEWTVPTTPLLAWYYDAVTQPLYRSVDGAQSDVPESDLPDDAVFYESLIGTRAPSTPPPKNSYVRTGSTPDIQTFRLIGHWWCSLALGYMGGQFAQYVYARRQRDAVVDAAAPS